MSEHPTHKLCALTELLTHEISAQISVTLRVHQPLQPYYTKLPTDLQSRLLRAPSPHIIMTPSGCLILGRLGIHRLNLQAHLCPLRACLLLLRLQTAFETQGLAAEALMRSQHHRRSAPACLRPI